MVDTIKFSQFASGGDLEPNQTTVGLDNTNTINTSFNNPFPLLPLGTTGDRPAPNPNMYYRLRFNTTLEAYEYYSPLEGWVQLNDGSGTVSPGLIDELAFYPANGTIVDGLPTANRAILRTNASGAPAWSAPLADGQVLIGSSGGAPAAASITAGPGISIAPGPNTLQISGTGSGIGWVEITGTTHPMDPDTGYVANNASLVVFTLPLTAAFGTVINVIGKGAGGWQINQNAGQNIQIGAVSSTVGTGGSIASVNRYNSLELVCTTADTTWTVLGAPQTAGFNIV